MRVQRGACVGDQATDSVPQAVGVAVRGGAAGHSHHWRRLTVPSSIHVHLNREVALPSAAHAIAAGRGEHVHTMKGHVAEMPEVVRAALQAVERGGLGHAQAHLDHRRGECYERSPAEPSTAPAAARPPRWLIWLGRGRLLLFRSLLVRGARARAAALPLRPRLLLLGHCSCGCPGGPSHSLSRRLLLSSSVSRALAPAPLVLPRPFYEYQSAPSFPAHFPPRAVARQPAVHHQHAEQQGRSTRPRAEHGAGREHESATTSLTDAHPPADSRILRSERACHPSAFLSAMSAQVEIPSIYPRLRMGCFWPHVGSGTRMTA
eukprot:COSAG03_NODE_587_length_6851_cov_27.995705_8_plen_319_part_00